MATPAQIEANRRNALKSTGPRTPDGKAVAARNAITHGLFCQHLLLDGEDETELESLRLGLYRRLRPLDELEKLYAERVVVAAWKVRRLLAAEQRTMKLVRADAAWVKDAADLYCHPEAAGEVQKFQKHVEALERSMDKALAALTKLQAHRPDDDDADDFDSPAPAPPRFDQNKPNLDGARDEGDPRAPLTAPPDRNEPNPASDGEGADRTAPCSVADREIKPDSPAAPRTPSPERERRHGCLSTPPLPAETNPIVQPPIYPGAARALTSASVPASTLTAAPPTTSGSPR